MMNQSKCCYDSILLEEVDSFSFAAAGRMVSAVWEQRNGLLISKQPAGIHHQTIAVVDLQLPNP